MPPPAREFSDIRYVVGNAVTGVRYITGPGENVGADAPPAEPARGGDRAAAAKPAAPSQSTPQGLPLLKPPYGRITAIDLTKGEHAVAGRARRDAGLRAQPSGAQGRERARAPGSRARSARW